MGWPSVPSWCSQSRSRGRTEFELRFGLAVGNTDARNAVFWYPFITSLKRDQHPSLGLNFFPNKVAEDGIQNLASFPESSVSWLSMVNTLTCLPDLLAIAS